MVTLDLAAHNLHMLRTHHWLKDPSNVIVLRLEGRAWQTEEEESAEVDRSNAMSQWTCADTVRFLREVDLEGPAQLCYASGVNGRDLLELTAETLCEEVRLSRFAARKVVAARDRFLSGA